MSTSAKPSICRICRENCGILVQDNGQEIKITGNPHHPISKGFICFRGKHFGNVHYAQDRLSHPLLKIRNQWVKISYDDAVEILASKFKECKKKYGGQSVVFYKGEALKHQEIRRYTRHLAHGFGTPNYISVRSLCYSSILMAYGMTSGFIIHPDFEEMKVAIAWGANPAVSASRTFNEIRKASKNGLKLIAIDPVCSRTARFADIHLPIIPGSDGFLALAFIKFAIEAKEFHPQKGADRAWNKLKSITANSSFQSLLRETGIQQSRFFETASLIFENLPGWIFTGSGLELQPAGFQLIRSLALLHTILSPSHQTAPSSVRLAPPPGINLYPDMPRPVGYQEAPLFIEDQNEGQGMYLHRAILEDAPYPVRAMLVMGGNPALTFPNSHIQQKALRKLDFLAVFDLFPTATTQLADLVLPAADFLENLELHDYGCIGRPYLGMVKPVTVSEKGWPTWKLLFQLAHKLELGHLFPWLHNRESLDAALKGTGISLSALEDSPSATVKYEPAHISADGKHSPDGQAVYFSEYLDSMGYAGTPDQEAVEQTLKIDDEFPFWLSTGDRVIPFQHSQFRNCPAYKRAMPEEFLTVHFKTAARLGIENGDLITLSTRHGTIDIRARIDDAIRPDCLSMHHGCETYNANELTGLENFDPVTGFPFQRAIPATINAKSNKEKAQ